VAKNTETNGGKQPLAHEQAHALRRADLAYVRLASSEVAGDINRDVILELVRVKQPVARVELARASGLRLALWIFRTGLETGQADFDLLDRLCPTE